MVSPYGLCGQGWIRTTEGKNQQIYSLPHLATLVLALTIYKNSKKNESKQIINYRFQGTEQCIYRPVLTN